ncbi:MAG: GGDEF domain-containing protein [Burkholderiaceae bacterium]
MDTRTETPAAIQFAKSALRRLAASRLEPTPANYRRAYEEEAGKAAPDAAPALTALAPLIERIVRGIEHGGKDWTAARKKDALARVLTGSRSDSHRLIQRLTQLVGAWDGDTASLPLDGFEDSEGEAGATPSTSVTPLPALNGSSVLTRLAASVARALPARDGESQALAAALAEATRHWCEDGPSPQRTLELVTLCDRADSVVQHHQRLFDQLGALCGELAASLAELAENDSWARGQCNAMRRQFDEGLTSRGLHSVGELLAQTRVHQARLRIERDRARHALKAMVASMLAGLSELGVQTGRFETRASRYADVIEQADTLEGLSGVVREMVDESRTVHAAVAQTRDRLNADHDRATELAQAVDQLEGELRRLSDEVSTDQLTQIANRRGLAQAFDAEAARIAQCGGALAVGLLDIDNFKRLNDELGHQAGDSALKALAASIAAVLRPTDKVARYGGEEFVVLLPQTDVHNGQLLLTRLQRALTGGLFMHEAKPVLVTFSAGVTALRDGESLDDAIVRADRAMYEAKRAGKNRTCIA